MYDPVLLFPCVHVILSIPRHTNISNASTRFPSYFLNANDSLSQGNTHIEILALSWQTSTRLKPANVCSCMTPGQDVCSCMTPGQDALQFYSFAASVLSRNAFTACIKIHVEHYVRFVPMIIPVCYDVNMNGLMFPCS